MVILGKSPIRLWDYLSKWLRGEKFPTKGGEPDFLVSLSALKLVPKKHLGIKWSPNIQSLRMVQNKKTPPTFSPPKKTPCTFQPFRSSFLFFLPQNVNPKNGTKAKSFKVYAIRAKTGNSGNLSLREWGVVVILADHPVFKGCHDLRVLKKNHPSWKAHVGEQTW